MTINSVKAYQVGQSIWYDNIQRRLLENGDLAAMVERGEIYGVTSNPSIFNNAIAKSSDYDEALIPLAKAGKSSPQIFEHLAVVDIQAAADLFKGVYETTEGTDGYVSLEVNPDLANDTGRTIEEAKRLWDLVDRPNLMIKIPATKAGIPAISEAIAAGLNVNVTLIFSQQRYEQVMDAYLLGLENRLADKKPVDQIASVASFFVSRVDSNVDAKLQNKVETGGLRREEAQRLMGKAAVANAKLAYQRFLDVFQSERFSDIQQRGARLQRPLWASTSTKNPEYSDVLYVENLIGPNTVNTIPPATLEYFNDHGKVALTLEENISGAEVLFEDLSAAGVDMDRVSEELEIAGVKAFSDAFRELLETVEARRKTVV